MVDELRRPDELPTACALGPTDGAARMDRWRALANGRLDVRHGSGEVVVSYEASRGVHEELESLVAAERECCGFADWQVTRESGNVVLHIRADAQGLAAIVGVFAQ
ncbi:MAG TPA: hypothetical protein VHX87_09275 [Galbitalea sp.]|nr:hypothetical protein [Galbitalea sp.]